MFVHGRSRKACCNMREYLQKTSKYRISLAMRPIVTLQKSARLLMLCLGAALVGCATSQTERVSRTAPAPDSENRCLVYGRVLFGEMPGVWAAQVTLKDARLFGSTYNVWCDIDGLYWLANVPPSKTWKITKTSIYRNGQWLRDLSFNFTQDVKNTAKIRQMPTLILDLPSDAPARVSLSHLEALQQDALRAALLNTRLVAWHALIRKEAGLP